MRKLIIQIHASEHEIDLDDYHEPDEELYYDSLYDGFIHEVITNPDYGWRVEDENGKKVEVV